MERTLPRPLDWRLVLLAAHAAGAVALIVIWAWVQTVGYDGDAHVYWGAELPRSYEIGWNVKGGYVYSPAFDQLLALPKMFPWPVFYAVWSAGLLAALAWLLTPLGAAGAVLVLPPFMEEVLSGNIHPFMAVALVLALRMPWVWPFLLLTKITPGVGLVWYVARREWHRLLVALGFTLTIIAVSAALAPDLWVAWGQMLLGVGAAPELRQLVTLPLPLRLLVSVAVIYWAGRTNRAWLLPLGAWFALPALWTASLTLLAAVPRITSRGTPR